MFINVIFVILTVLTLASIIRIILGPTVWDRLVGYNLFASKVSMLVVLYALIVQKSYLLDLAITFVLLGFIGVIFIANFVQKKGGV